MNLIPRNDWIVIKPTERKEMTAGGIVLPEVAKLNEDGLVGGTVLSVGPGMYQDGEFVEVPKDLVGKKVVYSRFTGSDIEHERKKYHILREFDVIAEVGDEE